MIYFSSCFYFNVFIFSIVLLLTGCDRILVKRIDLKRPVEPSQIINYEKNKYNIIVAIEHIAQGNNMSCEQNKGIIRLCTRNRAADKFIAFEDKNGFSTCYIVDGTPFDDSEFVKISSELENAITENVKDSYLNISPTDKLSECVVPAWVLINKRL